MFPPASPGAYGKPYRFLRFSCGRNGLNPADRHVAVVDYNSPKRQESAIFVHKHGKGSTAGCVSERQPSFYVVAWFTWCSSMRTSFDGWRLGLGASPRLISCWPEVRGPGNAR
ncbi:hypothetical protein CYJ40_01890 [Brevibacterium ravenspurgense]|uniref:YkuD domain-containing protein n=1 Tax=Brevibacterium ravenspurgense TaxID=479117 RepID=A0A2I1II85_9MICO|nr:hypothetical protein CYJ40_01890 [Brevibacterium ravenspurgense]